MAEWPRFEGEPVYAGVNPTTSRDDCRDPSRSTQACTFKALLAPYPADEMICWPVSARVGNVKNNDPSLIAPIAAA